jgi:hypothetical protein
MFRASVRNSLPNLIRKRITCVSHAPVRMRTMREGARASHTHVR